MAAATVPPALRTRLGLDASDELLEWMHSREESTMTACADRFESGLRSEIAQIASRLRGDMLGGLGELRALIALKHSELLKWAFLFWVGQAMWTVAMVVAALQMIER